jgi:pimeloyl-ACP methyl ester carboxylesterase
MKSKLFGVVAAVLVLAGVLVAGSSVPTTADASNGGLCNGERCLPIVYVHGGSGSAAQYDVQAQRFASNDYPNVVRALDRVDAGPQPVDEQMDDFFDAVMAETGDDQIYVLAHSYGALLMKDYLNSSPERSAKVAKFVSLDSSSAGENPECPGNPEPVDCIGIYRLENPNYMGPITYRLALHGHTQSVTSAESFAIQYEYFTGREPKTTLVLPEPPGQVEIGGRVVYFPANTPVEGSTLQIWEVDGDTGARIAAVPKQVIEIGPTGNFGPIKVNGMKNYEFTLYRTDVDFITHYYFQPSIRDNYLIRLLATPADSPVLTYTPMGPDHAALVVLRYFEWWSDQGAMNDTLWVTTKSPAWDDDPVNPTPPTLNILSNSLVAPRSAFTIGIHAHDANEDEVSTLQRVFPFYLMSFQTGVDIWMPTTEPPDGTITLTNEPRGDTTLPQTINIPNWASEGHRVLVEFNSYFQDINSWPECRAAKPSPCK